MCSRVWICILLLVIGTGCGVVYYYLMIPKYSAESPEDNIQFLLDTKEKRNVISLPSGLMYKVLHNGDGIYHPGLFTPVVCHYSGRLIDGYQFDSSYERYEPATLQPDQVIDGWKEALQLMVIGDSWEIYIPHELGYGIDGSPPTIPSNATLIFQLDVFNYEGDVADYVLKKTCIVSTKKGCNDREIEYINKVTLVGGVQRKQEGEDRQQQQSSVVEQPAWDQMKILKEIQRLNNVLSSKEIRTTKRELHDWIDRRHYILKQLVVVDVFKEEEEKEKREEDGSSKEEF